MKTNVPVSIVGGSASGCSNAPAIAEATGDKPSGLDLWIIQVFNVAIWVMVIELPANVLTLESQLNDYCRRTYFDGYNSADCSAGALSDCYHDSKCSLYHNFFDYDDNFFCSDNCEDCKCISGVTSQIFIALWVFIGIGLSFEFVRLILLCNLLGETIEENNLKSNLNIATKMSNEAQFQFLTDSIMLRLVQCLNARYYSNIMIHIYNQRKFFEMKSRFFVAFVLIHKIPIYICLIVLISTCYDDASSYVSWIPISFLIMIVLEISMFCIKIRYRNGEPYKLILNENSNINAQEKALLKKRKITKDTQNNTNNENDTSLQAPPSAAAAAAAAPQADSQALIQMQPMVANIGGEEMMVIQLPNGQLMKLQLIDPINAVVSAQPPPPQTNQPLEGETLGLLCEDKP